jgi:hypothetical protein
VHSDVIYKASSRRVVILYVPAALVQAITATGIEGPKSLVQLECASLIVTKYHSFAVGCLTFEL